MTVGFQRLFPQELSPALFKALQPHPRPSQGWQTKGQLVAAFKPSGLGGPWLSVAARGSLSQAHRLGEHSRTERPKYRVLQ